MKNKSNNQSGLVSLVVTFILITILTIIVIAFSNFSRREQTQTFERQLSTEAFYAAEAGINDALEKLLNDLPGQGYKNLANTKDQCQGGGDTTNPFDYELDGTGADAQVEYTCLLIDPAPEEIVLSSISSGESKALPLRHADGSPIDTVTIHWQDVDNGNTFTGCASSLTLPETWPADCHPGMLRIDIVPWPFGTPQTEADLFNNARTVFVKPRNNPTVTPIRYDTEITPVNRNGSIYANRAGCDSATPTPQKPQYCSIEINNLNATQYYIRIKSLYKSHSVVICSEDCADANGAGSTHRMADAQAVIDSTGRASDVLRRIQVRVGISGLDKDNPGAAIQSAGSICKKFSIAPPNNFDDESPGNCSY